MRSSLGIDDPTGRSRPTIARSILVDEITLDGASVARIYDRCGGEVSILLGERSEVDTMGETVNVANREENIEQSAS